MKDITRLPDAHLRVFDRPELPEPGSFRDAWLIGICGTGMGSLAGLLREAGYEVRGSDAAAWPPMSTRLAELGIPVAEGYSADNLDPQPDLVVVGNACTPTHAEAAAARDRGLVQGSFPEILARYFLAERRSIVVAGTHGKTTTTSLMVHVLAAAGCDPGFLVGGVMVNGNRSYSIGSGTHFVVEGDEYDSAYFDKRPKFLHYTPDVGIVTSMEFDHADIYDSWEDYRQAFRLFAASAAPDSTLVLNADDAEVAALAGWTRARTTTYGISPAADIHATGVRPADEGQHFTLVSGGDQVGDFYLPLSGTHNLQNTLAVLAVALAEGVPVDALCDGLQTFAGIKRRQEVRGEAGGVVVVDDFAHHPTAVRATLQAARERWPARRIVAVFEPRSNSSRRRVFQRGYQEAFLGADALFLSSPPFRHNDRREDFMDTEALLEAVGTGGVHGVVGASADELLPALTEYLAPGDVALIMSNGGFGGIHDRLLAALHAHALGHLAKG
ncbi:MAG: UDP-N-acetylmuramate--L-alanine ligase [Rhodothermales bacterium]|nr:UDP-N-acetylmuramate--L-alanine ligase [Rhodothermales bacterium]MBO6781352.1 UDP-N-acetylmuramate--L-alanine ligase [Rhodothermales bacterium]